MGKYYIFCNNNQVYHALAHNSIMCQAFKPGDYGVVTTSFMAENAIFVTEGKVCKELLYLGSSDVYYPTVLEIDDGCGEGGDASPIPARKVLMDGDVVSLSENLIPLNQCRDDDGCIGAFIYGEIPLCYLSRILFWDDNDMRNFRKSSPDLWFPQDLFARMDGGEPNCHLTKEVLTFASSEADSFLTLEDIASIRKSVLVRDKEKAAAYYMVEGTKDWNCNGIRTNVDGALIRLLDGDGHVLEDAAKMGAHEVADKSSTFDTNSFLAKQDSALEAGEDSLQNVILVKIKELLLANTENPFVDQDLFRLMAQSIKSVFIEKKELDGISEGLKAINDYVYLRTEYDWDATLNNLGESSVLRSLLVFLNQSRNIDFLRNVCEDVPQEERRYAYMMFGWYHGMASVDGAMKCNRQLERRLSDIVVSQFPNDMMVSSAGGSQEFCHAAKEEPSSVYGITPHFSVWYDCESSLELLLKKAQEDQLEHICKKILAKKSAVDFYKLDEPIVITIQTAQNKLRFELSKEADTDSVLNSIKKKIPAFFKKGLSFDAETFRKYLSDSKSRQSYRRYFTKHSDEIQELCRKVEK